MTKDDKRSEAARAMLALRWGSMSAAERADYMRRLRSKRTAETMGAARRSDKPRCPCGRMTLARALARGHRCEG